MDLPPDVAVADFSFFFFKPLARETVTTEIDSVFKA